MIYLYTTKHIFFIVLSSLTVFQVSYNCSRSLVNYQILLIEKQTGLIFPYNGFSSINTSGKRIKLNGEECLYQILIILLYHNYYCYMFINTKRLHNFNAVVLCK
jgi:hypothetical protein